MKIQDYHIIPYAEEYHENLIQLERGIIQGKNIQLEIIKPDFFSRANVFKKTHTCIALTGNDTVVGSAIAAQTTIKINDESFEAGFGFDTKVHPSCRNKGVGGMMAKELYKQFFIPKGLTKNFMTAKLSNTAVLKLVSRAVKKVWLYDFTYLTIPTSSRIRQSILLKIGTTKLGVVLKDEKDIPTDYYTCLKNGLGYFNTYKLYRLRIKKMSRIYKLGITILKKMSPNKYRALPKENDTLSFATLYNQSPGNIQHINEVLEQLESKGITQLLVCCKKRDAIYMFLKKIAINEYDYYIVSDFFLQKNDRVVIDVRCL